MSAPEIAACPECGESINYHDGWGGPNGCTLTDNGVAQRLAKAREAADSEDNQRR